MYIQNFLANLSFFLLFVTMIFYWVQAIFFSNQSLFFFGNYGMLFSNFCLISLLILRWQNSGHFPLSNLYESLIFLSWCVTTIHLILQKSNKNKTNYLLKINKNFFNQDLFISLWLGCITAPTALFINGFASFSLPKEMQEPSSLVPALQSNWLFMHVTVMILSYASLIIGCLLSFVFLILTEGQEINLKYSLFQKYYYCSNFMLNSFFNDNIKKNLFLNLKSLGNNFILISKTFVVLHKTTNFLMLRKKKKWDNRVLIERWLTKFNRSFFFLIPSNTYSMDASPANLSLSFCYDQPIIKLENKNRFLKIYSDEDKVKSLLPDTQSKHQISKLKRQFSKKRKNLTSKIVTNLDNLSYRILGIGFPFLTIGILSGSVWANEAWGSYWSWDPKETWALLTWLVFAIYFHSRLIKGWEGKKPAILATLGFIVVWICFIGVNLLKSGLHSYGFFS